MNIRIAATLTSIFGLCFPAMHCVSQETQGANIKANAISWLIESRTNSSDFLSVMKDEAIFFSHWPNKDLQELQTHQENFISLAATWRIVLRNIFELGQDTNAELSYFVGFLTGKCNAITSDNFRNKFAGKCIIAEVTSESRLGFAKPDRYLDKIEFQVSNGANVFQGQFPSLAGTLESVPGTLRRVEAGKEIWKSKIPMANTTGTLKGTWQVKPAIATVLVSADRIFCFTAFERFGIFLYEFDLHGGDLIRVHFFEFSYTRIMERESNEDAKGTGTDRR